MKFRTKANAALQAEIAERKQMEERLERLNRLKEDLLGPNDLGEKLKLITDGVVAIFEADFARIWITKPGDLCDSRCFHAGVTEGPHVCRYRDRCLHLITSSGRYTHVDGEVHRRVPFGCYKIGRVAAGEDPKFVTNDVARDPRVHDRDWARKLGLVSFAGYRLLSTDGQSIGVLALFSKHVISPEEDALLEGLANTIAQVIQTTTAEAALRESEARYRTLITKMLNGFALHEIICDEAGRPCDYRFLEVNPAFEAMTSLDATEIVGKTVLEVLPQTESYWIDTYGEVALTGNPVRFENYSREIDKYFEVLAYSPKKGQFATVFTDITERKRAEEALRQYAAELEAANAELEQFAYVISHDIRAPLRAIRNYVDFIQEDLVEYDEDLKLYLDGLDSAVREADELVGDLLELSRLGRQSIPIEAVDVGEFLERLIAILGPPADVEIVMADDWPTIEVEPILLGQIFQNLISNAIKFNHSPRKQVELGWHSIRGEQYELFVRDNGIGIDPRYYEQIFRVFERLHTSEEYEGTGIGLAIVKKAASKLGGSVRVESGPGEGSTFFVTLPRKREQSQEVVQAL